MTIFSSSQVIGVLFGCAWLWSSIVELWAGTSRRSWLLRAVVILALCKMMTMAGVYDGTIFFAAHMTTVAWVAWGWRIVFENKTTPGDIATTLASRLRNQLRVSLRDLLSVCVVVAVVCVQGQLVLEQAELPFDQLLNLLVVVLPFTSLTLLIAMLTSRREPIEIVAYLAITCLNVGLADGSLNHRPASRFADKTFEWPTLLLGTCLATALTAMGVSWRCSSLQFSAPTTTPPDRTKTWKTLASRLVFLSLGSVTLLPLLWSFIVLAWPVRPIFEVFPKPNGYYELAHIADETESSGPILDGDIAKKLSRDRRRTHAAIAALKIPARKQLIYSAKKNSPDLDPKMASALRSLQRSLIAHADTELKAENTEAAIESALACKKLGLVVVHGGVELDLRIGKAIEHNAMEWLWRNRQAFSPAQCRNVIKRLDELESQREPFADVEQREIAWWKATAPWHVRLLHRLNHQPPPTKEFAVAAENEAVCRARLMAVELSLAGFKKEHGRFPYRLRELVPSYLEDAPFDPFSDVLLRYSREGKSYLLYSVGDDRKDDGGAIERWNIDWAPSNLWGRGTRPRIFEWEETP